MATMNTHFMIQEIQKKKKKFLGFTLSINYSAALEDNQNIGNYKLPSFAEEMKLRAFFMLNDSS